MLGPGQFNWDITAIKRFKITEAQTMQTLSLMNEKPEAVGQGIYWRRPWECKSLWLY